MYKWSVLASAMAPSPTIVLILYPCVHVFTKCRGNLQIAVHGLQRAVRIVLQQSGLWNSIQRAGGVEVGRLKHEQLI